MSVMRSLGLLNNPLLATALGLGTGGAAAGGLMAFLEWRRRKLEEQHADWQQMKRHWDRWSRLPDQEDAGPSGELP